MPALAQSRATTANTRSSAKSPGYDTYIPLLRGCNEACFTRIFVDTINCVYQNRTATEGRNIMLHYAIIFFIIAIIAAVFGFGGIAAGASSIAQILFVVFLVLAIGSFFFGRGK